MSNVCIVIPTYNDTDTIPPLLDRLSDFGLPILIVNDGSRQPTYDLLEELAAKRDDVRVKHRPVNGGKGAAVIDGLHWAHELGYLHALQIDADGQHETQDVPKFLAIVERAPGTLVLGEPIFDEDVPKGRLYGRQLSKWMIWIHTLSRSIHDPLFGFRIYPVPAFVSVCEKVTVGRWMDFDPHIAVRLYWAGVPVANVASPVRYPEGGLSNFKMIQDNVRLTGLYIRLTFGMFIRIPKLLRYRGRNK